MLSLSNIHDFLAFYSFLLNHENKLKKISFLWQVEVASQLRQSISIFVFENQIGEKKCACLRRISALKPNYIMYKPN